MITECEEQFSAHTGIYLSFISKTTHFVVPVIELVGTRLAAEVSGHATELLGHASLTELVAMVTAHTLETQPLDKILLKQ